MSAIELENSLSELQHFYDEAKTTRVKQILSSAIANLKLEISNIPKIVPTTVEPIEKKVEIAPKPAVTFSSMSSFSWDQEKNTVSIYILDGVDGVDQISKENVTCDFEESVFDLRIVGLNGRNLRLRKNLYSKILPDKCKMLVRKNRITLKLAKAHEENWMQLEPQQSKFKEPTKNSDDPSAGLMDLMKDMYQSGDDNMKRTIAEAWTKAQSGERVGGDDM